MRLHGSSMQQVVSLLGRPAQVYKTGDRESWDYQDVAYDSVTNRTVERLNLWFINGVVDDVQASF
jgi:hypothetical protein